MIARCLQIRSGSHRWRLCLGDDKQSDVTIVVRMDPGNQAPLDYYLLPRIDLQRANIQLAEANDLGVDGYRFDTLDDFYRVFKTSFCRRGRMMTRSQDQMVEMIPIDRISVINPRARNKRTHREIVDNIESIGLKRPITVSRRSGLGEPRYDLVCGEGRLEAFRMLGETKIPAIVREASEADCLVMSLVENVARRQHRPIDIMNEIGSLSKRGYSAAEIGGKIGLSPAYVAMIVVLLERGEERLVAAVESGLIPVSFAIDIARADHAEVQDVLMDAYAAGQIKGKKLSSVRRLLDQRVKRSKTVPDPGLGLKNPGRKFSAKDLMRIYEREADKQRLLVKKSDFAQARLLFVVEALKDLLADEGFRTLLRAEQLETMPRALTVRIFGELAH